MKSLDRSPGCSAVCMPEALIHQSLLLQSFFYLILALVTLLMIHKIKAICIQARSILGRQKDTQYVLWDSGLGGFLSTLESFEHLVD